MEAVMVIMIFQLSPLQQLSQPDHPARVNLNTTTSTARPMVIAAINHKPQTSSCASHISSSASHEILFQSHRERATLFKPPMHKQVTHSDRAVNAYNSNASKQKRPRIQRW